MKGDAASTRIANFKVKHSSMQLQSKQLVYYTGTDTKTHKTKAPKTNCKV